MNNVTVANLNVNEPLSCYEHVTVNARETTHSSLLRLFRPRGG